MTARSRKVVVVGDVVLDRDLVGRVERVCPDAPVPVIDVVAETGGPGAAALTALLCAGPGIEVTLVAPVGQDSAGTLLRESLERGGVDLVALQQAGPTRRNTRVRSQRQSLLRLDDGGPSAPDGPLPQEAVSALEEADVVVVSCYGAGTSSHAQLRSLLAENATHRPVLWDPHPRGAAPVPGCALVTPNLAEAHTASGMPGAHGDDLARHLASAWSARGVCVTAGESGAWLATSTGEPVHFPTTAATGDSCGAGDAFVAAAATALARGRTTSESVADAVLAAREWVVGGGTSGYRDRAAGTAAVGTAAAKTAAVGSADAGVEKPSAMDVARRIAAQSGTLVATGGCFDILHAGHVASLEAARRLGDALVVLLNSDESVRRLKGAGRPVQSSADRARVLLGLSCVDAVMIFGEQGPESALEDLRPDVWVKGGDYEGTELPEAALVRSWGGRVVLIPYEPGYSTTAILADTAKRVGVGAES